jgi:hypothetical protein
VVIGNGQLASLFFKDYAESPDWLVFASGVSNSQEEDSRAFLRERQLLLRHLDDGLPMAYFSTCAANVPEASASSRYVRHKVEMERLVQERAVRSVIFRLPQVVGRAGNPHTLCNFLYDAIRAGKSFNLWKNADRNLVDASLVRDVVHHTLNMPKPDQLNVEICAPENISLTELVSLFEGILGVEAKPVIVDAGVHLPVDHSYVASCAEQLSLDFGSDYYELLLRKYYGK